MLNNAHEKRKKIKIPHMKFFQLVQTLNKFTTQAKTAEKVKDFAEKKTTLNFSEKTPMTKTVLQKIVPETDKDDIIHLFTFQ